MGIEQWLPLNFWLNGVSKVNQRQVGAPNVCQLLVDALLLELAGAGIAQVGDELDQTWGQSVDCGFPKAAGGTDRAW
jgi:hypothetical protein